MKYLDLVSNEKQKAEIVVCDWFTSFSIWCSNNKFITSITFSNTIAWLNLHHLQQWKSSEWYNIIMILHARKITVEISNLGFKLYENKKQQKFHSSGSQRHILQHIKLLEFVSSDYFLWHTIVVSLWSDSNPCSFEQLNIPCKVGQYHAYYCPGSTLTTAIWCCCNHFSQWQCSFLWKLHSRWLKFFWQHHVAVVRPGLGPHVTRPYAVIILIR